MRVLCYGDSNTWGFTAGTGERRAPDARWTGVAQRLLGDAYTLAEEGMNGRTTVYENPCKPARKGSDALLTCLISQKPLDLVVLMLGTNDLPFTDAYGATRGVQSLIRAIRLAAHLEESTPIFPNGMKLLLVAPIHAHRCLQKDPYEARIRRYEESFLFAPLYAELAKQEHVGFLDAALYAEPSEIDGLHMTAESHLRLGKAMAEAIRGMLEN